jgi:putative transposase
MRGRPESEEKSGRAHARLQDARLSGISTPDFPEPTAAILREQGIDPAPQRQTNWRQLLKSQRAALGAMDFFTTEVWTGFGLETFHTLFAIDHATRAVAILGTTTNPDGAFMAQVARNITGVADGWWCNKTFLLHDRDTMFTAQFRRILGDAGMRCIATPVRAPNANASPSASCAASRASV